jgi:3-oxoacyl-[acyl-carrier protein] reductase
MSSRVVVVTGSSSGPGQAIAEAFALNGDEVVVHGNRNQDGLRKSEQLVRAANRDCLTISADIADFDQQDRLVREAFAWRNRVDVWVNAAGADVLTGDARHLSFEQKLELLWKVDVQGTIRLSRAVAERMANQTSSEALPSIINISWDQADSGMEGESGQYFCTTKAAIASFSKSLAKSVAPRVRVNCIAPGWIQTAWGQTASPEWDKRAKRESLLQRWGNVGDIANAAVFLADHRSEFVNGHVLPVNGGRTS